MIDAFLHGFCWKASREPHSSLIASLVARLLSGGWWRLRELLHYCTITAAFACLLISSCVLAFLSCIALASCFVLLLVQLTTDDVVYKNNLRDDDVVMCQEHRELQSALQ